MFTNNNCPVTDTTAAHIVLKDSFFSFNTSSSCVMGWWSYHTLTYALCPSLPSPAFSDFSSADGSAPKSRGKDTIQTHLLAFMFDISGIQR